MDERELKELSSLFSLSRDAVLCVRAGIIIFANAAAGELFPGCVGSDAAEWLPPFLTEGQGESWICTLPGDEGPISVSCVRRGDALLLSLPRREQPRTVIPAAALAELRTTAYNLHMSAELMLRHSDGSGKAGTYAAILQHNYYRLLRLTRNLADVNTLLQGELELRRESVEFCSLCRRLVDSVSFFTRKLGAELSFEHSGSGFFLAGDRERLEQLILNLISNALLHTEKGGKIRLSLRSRRQQLILSVDDDGCGMSEGALGALFTVREEPLFTEGGAGLGLYVAQGIVRAHGGSMLIESKAGLGTQVRVMLPTDEKLSFRDGEALPCGPGLILTELSTVLGHESYDKRYRD